MKTLEEIKTELSKENHNRQYELNGEVFDMTDAELNEAIDKKAQMVLVQEEHLEQVRQDKLVKISAYRKLGLTDQEIIALIGLSPEEALELL